MKAIHRNRFASTLAAFALTAALAGSVSAARTSASDAPLDWPERWVAAHSVDARSVTLEPAASSSASAPLDWPERWAAAHPHGAGLVLTLARM